MSFRKYKVTVLVPVQMVVSANSHAHAVTKGQREAETVVGKVATIDMDSYTRALYSEEVNPSEKAESRA